MTGQGTARRTAAIMSAGTARSAPAGVEVHALHAEAMPGERGGGGDVRLVGRDGQAAAHVVGRGRPAAIDEQVAAADGIEAELADAGRGFDVLADERLGVAAADDRQEQQGVRFGGELAGRAREQHDGPVGALADEGGREVHGALRDEAASKQDGVDRGKGGVGHPGEVVRRAGVVGINEHGQSLAAGSAVGFEGGNPPG